MVINGKSKLAWTEVRFVLSAGGVASLGRHDSRAIRPGTILVQSDIVAVLGGQIAQEFRRAYPIELRDLPLKSLRLHAVMLRHRRFDDQAAHRWQREMMALIAGAHDTHANLWSSLAARPRWARASFP